jgi:hypothetical protein
VPGGNPPVGPGNNIAGSSLTTSTTAATAVGGGPSGGIDTGRLITLLGQTAQAVDPEGFGGRLGAVAVENQRQINTAKALAKSLAGEDLTAEELAGLTLDDAERIQRTSALKREEERADRTLDLQEQTQQAEEERLRQERLITLAGQTEDPAQQAALISEAGVTDVAVDLQTATEKEKDLIVARGIEDRKTVIEEGKRNIARDAARLAEEFNYQQKLKELKTDLADQGIDQDRIDAITFKLMGAGVDLIKADRLDEDGLQGFIDANLPNFGIGTPKPVDPNADLFKDVGAEVEGEEAVGPTPAKVREAFNMADLTDDEIGDMLLQLQVLRFSRKAQGLSPAGD